MVENIFNAFKNKWFQLVIIFAISFLAYSNSFHVPFHFDDDQQIRYKESNQTLQQFSKIDTWFHVNQRPVSSFTLAVNYVLGGENVLGYHLVNFLIHFSSGLFLFFLLSLLLLKDENKIRKSWLPFVVTLFFLVQPVQTQAVTYIVQRMTSLAGMFVILSVLLYVKGRIYYLSTSKIWGSVIYIGASIFAGTLGLLSKQNAIVFPILFLLVEFLFIRTNENKLCKKYLFISVSILSTFFIVYGFVFGLPSETKEISRGMYLATQMTVIPRYFQMMLMPFGLSIDHGVKVVESILNLKVILGSLFLISIFAFAIVKIKSQPFLSFGIFWIFITLSIESSIIPIRDVMFDHRMYLPLLGFSVALWSLVFEFLQLKKTKLLFPIIAIVILIMTTGTYARNKLWQSEVKMWKKVTEMYPDYFRGWQGLGRSYVVEDGSKVNEIIRSYKKALSIEPENETVINDLGANYLKVRDFEKGIPLYEKLVNTSNEYYKVNALKILGAYYLEEKKNFDLAEPYLKKLFDKDPNNETALFGLSSLYMQLQDYKESIKYARKCNKLFPGNEDLLFNLGLAYLNTGNPDKAIIYAKEIYNLEPENVNAMLLYANASVNLKDYPSAIRSLQMAYETSKNQRYLDEIEKVKKMMSK